MDSDKYLEGQSMQRPPLFESDSFIYWKNRFETYVKSKDLDLWHVITNGDFQPIIQNPETKLDEVVPFEKQTDDLKRRLAKNNEAKMVIYNALPRKEYERIFMCNTAKEIRKLCNPPFKLIGNLKVHEMIIKKDSEIVKAKVKRKSLALKAKKESRDEECSTFSSEDEEDPNHLIGDASKATERQNQIAIIEVHGAIACEEEDEKIQDEHVFVAQAPSEICFETSYFSDENSSIDDLALDNEYDKLCKMTLKIITKNKRLKPIRNSLENELRELKDKLSILEKNKGVDLDCAKSSKELVRNLPKLKFDQHFCDACKIRKHAHVSHKAKNIVSTTRCLELLHMDLFGPSAVRSYRGNRYTLVIVDDYSRYTWTRFLKNKTKAFDQFKIFSKKIQNQLGCTIVSIRTDHGREFDNEVQFGEFCNANGITHNFSAPRTPQSNGVVERKNRTLQEMSRTMLNEQSLPQKFWCNAVDTSTYILNRILIRAILGKTPYEILRGRKPTLDYFRVFGSKCFILNTKDYLTKFDPKSYEGVFLGYSQNSKAYIILNKHTRKIEESLNVTFDETPPPSKTSPLVDDDLDEEEAIREIEKKNLENVVEDETLEIDEIVNIKESRNHPLENVIGNLNQRTLRSQAQNQSNFFCFISTIEPKNVNEALGDKSWIVAMQEELNQFIANDVWEFSKKQTALAISTIEAEYVSAGKACQQALWMKQALIDYDVRLDDVPIMCDNKGAIDLSKNPVQHSRTKHIEIRHHFLRDNVQKGHILIEKVRPPQTSDIL
ncbi:retrovirus-related pol polyprotein from transposon TNT 1-94 [Tanacetum coccineum]